MDLTQYQEWRDYYHRNPWGPHRDDMRQAAFLAILLGAFSGQSNDFTPLYPYSEAIDWEVELQEAIDIDAALEPDGKGGYVWKGGKRPDGIRDRS